MKCWFRTKAEARMWCLRVTQVEVTAHARWLSAAVSREDSGRIAAESQYVQSELYPPDTRTLDCL